MKNVIMLEFCRLCQSEIGAVPIDGNLGKKINHITRVQIQDELPMNMPTNICITCHNKILDTEMFIEMVQKEDQNLRNLVKKQLMTRRIDSIVSSSKSYSGENPDKCESTLGRSSSEYLTSEDITEHFESDKSHPYLEKDNFGDIPTDHPITISESNQLGNRPFLCVTCGKDFMTKNSLTCHEKIHSAIKGYRCDLCNIGFSVRSNLRAHIRKYHEGVRFYCSQCTKQFLTKCSLDRHEKIHAGIKEFKCELCTSAFYTNKELVKHQRYHKCLVWSDRELQEFAFNKWDTPHYQSCKTRPVCMTVIYSYEVLCSVVGSMPSEKDT